MGSWIDHGNIAPAQVAHLIIIHSKQVTALEEHLSCGDLAVGRQQAHHSGRNRALAAARLTHQPDDLAALHLEVHIPRCRESRLAGMVLDLQVHGSEGCVHHSPLVPDRRGSSTSRKASPNKVKPSVVSARVRPDQMIGHWDSKM